MVTKFPPNTVWASNSLPIGNGAGTVAQQVYTANTFPAMASTGDFEQKTITDFGLSLVDDANAATARATLGGTTIGQSYFTLTNPSATTFPQMNPDNTVTALNAADFRTAIGAGAGDGDVSFSGASPTMGNVALFADGSGNLIEDGGPLGSAAFMDDSLFTQFAFSTIAVASQSSIVADSTGDTLTIVAGTGITLTTNASTDTLTISATASGTVTSVNLTQPAAGITVSGGPITTSGSITLALANDLAALEALTGTDTIYYRSGVSTWTAVTIGSGIAFSGGSLTATGGSGTVTSIDVSGGTTGLTTSGGPVTTSGSITLAGTLVVANGGTGRTTSTTAYGLIAAGTTATGVHQTLAAGATTEILVGGGSSALPAWTTATGTGAPVRAGSPALTGTPTAPTAAPGTNTTQVATTAFTAAAVSAATLDIVGLTATDIDVLDTIPIYDASAAANRKVTAERMLGYGLMTPQGRLSTSSTLAVPAWANGSVGTIYWVPYHGNRVWLYDGSRWKMYIVPSALSLAVSITNGDKKDVFLYDNAGTLTLEFSAAWTNNTTRADAVSKQDGMPVKSGAATRLHVGTIWGKYYNGSTNNLIEMGKSVASICNVFNPVPWPLQANFSTASWPYATATWRRPNGGSAIIGENQVGFVQAYDEHASSANLVCQQFGGTGHWSGGAVDMDWSSGDPTSHAYGGFYLQNPSNIKVRSGIGAHTFDWLEFADGVSTTFYGRGGTGGNRGRSGLYAEVMV